MLESVNKDLWPEVVKLLTSDGMITVSPQFESQFDIIHFLFKEMVWNMNGLDHHGNTPLHIACLAVDLNFVRTITSFTNCDFNIQNKHGNTALSIACRYNLDLVKFLIEIKHCKVLIRNKDGELPLHHACRLGNLDVVKYLVNMITVKYENNTGDTPLCVAVGFVHTDVVQFLVEIDNCDVNHQNKNGDTPLHIACRIGNIHVVRALTDFKNRNISCDLNIKNNQEETPALIAYNKHHSDIFRLLVTEHHCACECLLIMLERISKDQWPEVVGILIADGNGKDVTIPSFFGSKLKVISFLAEEKI